MSGIKPRRKSRSDVFLRVIDARKVLGDVMADISVLLLLLCFSVLLLSFDLELQIDSNQFLKFAKIPSKNLGQ
jgi:hypothetical protein